MLRGKRERGKEGEGERTRGWRRRRRGSRRGGGESVEERDAAFSTSRDSLVTRELSKFRRKPSYISYSLNMRERRRRRRRKRRKRRRRKREKIERNKRKRKGEKLCKSLHRWSLSVQRRKLLRNSALYLSCEPLGKVGNWRQIQKGSKRMRRKGTAFKP